MSSHALTITEVMKVKKQVKKKIGVGFFVKSNVGEWRKLKSMEESGG